MITIENLEVNLDVAGDDDEETFARLFKQYFNQFMQAAEEERAQQEEGMDDRSLGGTYASRGGQPW